MGLGHPKNDFELFETMFKSLRDVCVWVYVCVLGVGVKLFVLRIYSFYRSKLKPSWEEGSEEHNQGESVIVSNMGKVN